MKKTIFLLTIICTLLACSKEEGKAFIDLDCEQTENFTSYSGEEIECQFYFTLTEYNNQQYIELNSRCADLFKPYVINENCEDICENAPFDANSECAKYLNDRAIVEIILIEE